MLYNNNRANLQAVEKCNNNLVGDKVVDDISWWHLNRQTVINVWIMYKKKLKINNIPSEHNI